MADSLTNRVALEVKLEMVRQGVSQRKVGEILGISQPQVSARLRGEIAFNTIELGLLAEAWSIPAAQFVATTASAA